MNIEVLELHGTNCYLLSSDKAAIVIDPGVFDIRLQRFLDDNAGKERLIILTHGHFDHIGGADALRRKTEVKIAVGEKDSEYLCSPALNLCGLFGVELEPFKADIVLKNNELLSVGDISFKVLERPGHTLGSICLLTDNILFSGDVLFKGSIGRSDFPFSDPKALESSLKSLMELDDKTVVLSGHGEQTTIEQERLYNPFLRGIL